MARTMYQLAEHLGCIDLARAINNAKVPRRNLQMGNVAFAFVPAAWGFTKQPTLEVMAFSQMAHYWGALTLSTTSATPLSGR